VSNSDILIEGPSMLMLQAEAESIYSGLLPKTPAHVSVDLPVTNAQYPVTIQSLFNFNESNDRWEFGNPSDERPRDFLFA